MAVWRLRGRRRRRGGPGRRRVRREVRQVLRAPLDDDWVSVVRGSETRAPVFVGPNFALASERMYRCFALPCSIRIFSSVWLRYQFFLAARG